MLARSSTSLQALGACVKQIGAMLARLSADPRKTIDALKKLGPKFPRLVFHVMAVVYDGVRSTWPWLWRWLDSASLFMVSACRLSLGGCAAAGVTSSHRPKEMLQLYEFEACSFCKTVRETLSVLDLEVAVFPCPRESLMAPPRNSISRFRPTVAARGGAMALPYLEDRKGSRTTPQSGGGSGWPLHCFRQRR
eukprot:GHVT01087742.1.p1 GENE.GHVT01087742.1~~GHVT01087742.1.p1  ORF type:complete len:193 (+),score=27.79 GHVT01087742.1:804-1382(+)